MFVHLFLAISCIPRYILATYLSSHFANSINKQINNKRTNSKASSMFLHHYKQLHFMHQGRHGSSSLDGYVHEHDFPKVHPERAPTETGMSLLGGHAPFLGSDIQLPGVNERRGYLVRPGALNDLILPVFGHADRWSNWRSI
jgi:hypothetical protein